jgi:hypothetical protein
MIQRRKTSAVWRGGGGAVEQIYVQGGALNRGLFFVDPPPSLLGAVSGKISENRWAAA